MTREQIEERVRGVLAEVLALDESAISLKSDLRSDFDASSLDLVQLLWTLEEELETQIPDEAVDGFHTATDIVDYVEGHLSDTTYAISQPDAP